MTLHTPIISANMNTSDTSKLSGMAEPCTTSRPASGSNPRYTSRGSRQAQAGEACITAEKRSRTGAAATGTTHTQFGGQPAPVSFRLTSGVLAPKPVRGFTLVELVLVIMILGVLGALGAGILLQPFKAFQDQSRRAAMVAEADLTLGYMARELRMALPNSVRVSGQFIEFIPTVDGGRYRSANTSGGQGDSLDLTALDTSFDVIGGLSAWAQPGGSNANDHVVIYNTHATDNVDTNAYNGVNRGVLTGYDTSTHTISLNPPGTQFPAGSTSRRFDIVPATGPVTYYCNSGRLYRHTSYGFQLIQRTDFTNQGALLADNVSLCDFSYLAGSGTRSGVASLRLAITRDGETISLLYQVQIINAP